MDQHFFFSEQFTPTLQRSNHDPLRSPHQYCMKNSPDPFVLVVLTDTLIYLNLYMYTIYEITIIFVIWKVGIVRGKFSAVLQKACLRTGAGGVGVSGVTGAELHWPLTKIMWCHFNLTSGLFLHPASFSSGFALWCRSPGTRWGPKPCHSRRCSA